MNNNPIDKINSAFDSHDQKKDVAEKKKTERQLFLEEFEKIKSQIIKPTMEGIGNVIKQQGHTYSIEPKEGNDELGNIRIEIFPNGETPDFVNKKFPYLSFVADKHDIKVNTIASTLMPNQGGMTGRQSTYSLKEITVEVVQEEISRVINKSFGA